MSGILFFCMGNICRSPTVEAVARAQFARAGLDLTLASAGTESYHSGDGADPRSVATAKRRGYALNKHRARRVSDTDFHEFDWLLAMDDTNLRTLLTRCPAPLSHKVLLFLPFAGIEAPRVVPDPYYGRDADFEHVVDLAERGCAGLVARLRERGAV